MKSIAALILAGGKSSRMGQDKALIPIQGVPLLQQICEVARQCATEVYVVTPWTERYQDLLPDGCSMIQEVPLADGIEPHGPLVGFAQGLRQVKTDWVLLLACDLPLLDGEILQQWAEQLEDVSPEAIAFLPRNPQGWWEPLCGFYRRSVESKLNEFIAQGGRSFQRWLPQHPVQELTLTNPQLIFNCNSPNDLAAIENSQSSL